MFALLLTTLIATYHAEDFHYYDDNLQQQPLLYTYKVYVHAPDEKSKKQVVKFTNKLTGMDRFKEFDTGELSGIILFFPDKYSTLKALNDCADHNYKAYPIVLYNGIECSTTGEITVTLQTSVNQDDFMTRLQSVVDGEFTLKRTAAPKVYVLNVKNLNNPSNILILANMIAKDSFWVKSAVVGWLPLEGYVTATASVETPSMSHLGQTRNLKVVINAFEPDIKVRTDLLPQLGQGLVPFPNAGELWFDAGPQEITQTVVGRKKTVIVNYPFRQLQFGSFAFQPILISYEHKGKLMTTKTNVCQYGVQSVIAGTDIDDIQPRSSDGLELNTVPPIKLVSDVKRNPYTDIKGISIAFAGLGVLLLGTYVLSLRHLFSGNKDNTAKLWTDLKNTCLLRGTWQENYLTISRRLNTVMTEVFGVSLYAVNMGECNDNFKVMVKELNKIYEPQENPPALDETSLAKSVMTFCKRRSYKNHD